MLYTNLPRNTVTVRRCDGGSFGEFQRRLFIGGAGVAARYTARFHLVTKMGVLHWTYRRNLKIHDLKS